MTADKNLDRTNPDFTNHLGTGNTSRTNQSIGTMDMLKRDRFELLSAYLDGEVTAAQRQEVENWLSNDPESQRLYGRLLNLRQGLQTMPVPPVQQPVEQTLEQVYQRMHRRNHRRTIVWGGSAIAAILIGAVSILPTRQVIQMAKSPTQLEPLMVALNDPVVEIPKAQNTSPQQPMPSASPQDQNKNFN